MRNKQKSIVVLLVLALCLLTACGENQEEEVQLQEDQTLVPNAYFVGSESIIAVQPEAGVMLTGLNAEDDGTLVYTYSGFAAVNESVQKYVEMLISTSHGFSVVDGETFHPAAMPDYTSAEGTVTLSKPSDNDKITVVRVDWYDNQCVASIGVKEAPVIEPPEPQTSINGNKNPSHGLSHTGAVDYLKGLHPSVLELEGDSMADYNIYIMTGFTYVDGEACLRVKICSSDNAMGTNVHEGTYFMSGNGEHIYRLSEDGLAIEMDQKR